MKALLGSLIFIALCVSVLAGLIRGLGIAEPFVPDPESEVQDFVSKLSAGRYDVAQANLSDDIKNEWQIANLKQLDQELESKLGDYEIELGGQEEQQGKNATYHALIKTEQQDVQTIDFELEQDQVTHLWKISSLDALKELAEK
ncbi:MAG: hypothetical protein HZB51_20255 [Chloroflexi bacterium]|nr:hypothetical protein [Chloroflexota bacterium]